MRLIFKVICTFGICICLVVSALCLFGFFALPDSIVADNESDNSESLIYKVQSVSSDGHVRNVDGKTDSSGENTYYSLLGIFPLKKVDITSEQREYVYLSGRPFGLKLYSDGVLVVAVDDFVSENEVSPAKKAGVQAGDIVRKMNGKTVVSNKDVSQVISSSDGGSIELLIDRKGKEIKLNFTPVRSDGGTLKAGMWIRDSFAGIGTMTFYTDTKEFGGLGHAVSDVDTGQSVPISGGEAVETDILGCIKGTGQTAGELYGSFTDSKLGDLEINCERGVYGHLASLPLQRAKVPVASKKETSTGDAQIIATVDENGPQYYDIRIIKLLSSSDNNTKNMVIEVTDEKLISLTGGIVQGMSGSPIIQNGMFVGAVTHVFINNPMQGYAIYAENMLSESNKLQKETQKAA